MNFGLEVFLNVFTSVGCIVFFVLGIFGNCMIIAVVIKKKELRQKAGILLAITSASHNISLTCELANAYYSIVVIFVDEIPRRICYMIMFPYMFTFMHQAGMYFVSVLDLLFAIIFPLWYLRVNINRYIFYMTLFPNIIGAIMLVTTIITYEDDHIQRCNAYTVLVEPYAKGIFQTLCFLNFGTLILFIITLIQFKIRKSKTNLTQASQILRRISVTALIFTFSWFIAIYGASMIMQLPLPLRDRYIIQAICVVPAVIAYSSNFLACWFRSQSYRQAFLEILGLRRIRHYSETRHTTQPSQPSQLNNT